MILTIKIRIHKQAMLKTDIETHKTADGGFLCDASFCMSVREHIRASPLIQM